MTHRLLLGFLLVSLVFSAPVSSARAQEGALSDKVLEAEETAQSVRERVGSFIEGFSRGERTHFYAVYDSHNLVSVVKHVQKSVGEGVQQCGANNPEMKDDLQVRFKDWKAAISEVLEEAEGNISNMIAVQDYAKSRDFKKLLKFVDKKRKETENSVEKVPVTTPEACQFLLDKMDDTQEQLIGLLRSTLVSLPQALQNAQEQEKEDAAAAEKAAQEKVEAEKAEEL